MPIWTLTAAALLMHLVHPAHAEGGYFTTGEDLLGLCKAKGGTPSRPSGAAAVFAGATSDAIELLSESTKMKIICAPQDATAAQMAALICTYLDRHPEKRQNGATSSALAALREAYPCADQR